MAIALANERDISLVLANDPDADRFCAAERTGQSWHIFTGNEMGIILAHHILTQYKSIRNFDLCTRKFSSSDLNSAIGDAILCRLIQNATQHGRKRGFPP